MSVTLPLWASIAAGALVATVLASSTVPATGTVPANDTGFAASTELAAPTTAIVQPSVDTHESRAVVTPIADGDCTKILNLSTVALSFSRSKNAVTHWGDPLYSSVGGIKCDYWFGPIEDYVGSVFLIVAPIAISDSGTIDRSLAAPECSTTYAGSQSTNGCRATATVGGWWYSLMVEGPAKKQKSAFDKITSALTKTLAATSAPTQVDQPKHFDCAAVDTGGLPVTTRRNSPSDWPSTDVTGAEIQAAAFLLAGPTTCRFTLASGKSWNVTVYPQGDSLFYRCGHFSTIDDYPGPSSVISIPGVKSAYGKVATNDGPLLCATDGTSLVSVSGDYDLILTAKARTALGSILVPVLAASE
jgi:hypothetical protein